MTEADLQPTPSLHAENLVLRKALEPFAEIAKSLANGKYKNNDEFLAAIFGGDILSNASKALETE